MKRLRLVLEPPPRGKPRSQRLKTLTNQRSLLSGRHRPSSEGLKLLLAVRRPFHFRSPGYLGEGTQPVFLPLGRSIGTFFFKRPPPVSTTSDGTSHFFSDLNSLKQQLYFSVLHNYPKFQPQENDYLNFSGRLHVKAI